MTNDSPDIEQTLIEFGNTAKAIPYYAVYRPGEDPVHFNGVFTGVRKFLNKAGISEEVNTEVRNVSEESPVESPAAEPLVGASN